MIEGGNAATWHAVEVDVIGKGSPQEVWLVVSSWTDHISSGQISFAGSRAAHASSIWGWIAVGDVEGLILAVFSDSNLLESAICCYEQAGVLIEFRHLF